MSQISIRELKELLRYDPLTGKLFWKHRPLGPSGWNTRFAGKETFTNLSNKGYLKGVVKTNNHLMAHRVAWALYHGEWPPSRLEIDHINRDKTDNRIANLRLVTSTENNHNQKGYRGHTSIFRGVSLHRQTGRWQAVFTHQKKTQHLGLFDDEEDAAKAYDEAAFATIGSLATLNFS